MHTLFNLVLQQDLNIDKLEPVTRSEVAATLSSHEERMELIQLMCAMEILCPKVPESMEAEVEGWAEALGVEEPSLLFLRDLALGQAAQAQHEPTRTQNATGVEIILIGCPVHKSEQFLHRQW